MSFRSSRNHGGDRKTGKGNSRMEQKLTIIGCILWIAGLAAAIIGLNLEGNAGTWTTVCGNIAFFAGVGILGVVWFRNRRNQGK